MVLSLLKVVHVLNSANTDRTHPGDCTWCSTRRSRNVARLQKYNQHNATGYVENVETGFKSVSLDCGHESMELIFSSSEATLIKQQSIKKVKLSNPLNWYNQFEVASTRFGLHMEILLHYSFTFGRVISGLYRGRRWQRFSTKPLAASNILVLLSFGNFNSRCSFFGGEDSDTCNLSWFYWLKNAGVCHVSLYCQAETLNNFHERPMESKNISNDIRVTIGNPSLTRHSVSRYPTTRPALTVLQAVLTTTAECYNTFTLKHKRKFVQRTVVTCSKQLTGKFTVKNRTIGKRYKDVPDQEKQLNFEEFDKPTRWSFVLQVDEERSRYSPHDQHEATCDLIKVAQIVIQLRGRYYGKAHYSKRIKAKPTAYT
ncbi:hypothetical protein CLF_106859 [Clonorchis sinensis]|uniref:Uncharacterized protein n=1 Tax=Clonorchis sinensis TaxID=79923 RepID=G7YQ76_CLOSI|nr:hypothetical protein CLF_106859 [Clonorchis sinensis]